MIGRDKDEGKMKKKETIFCFRIKIPNLNVFEGEDRELGGGWRRQNWRQCLPLQLQLQPLLESQILSLLPLYVMKLPYGLSSADST